MSAAIQKKNGKLIGMFFLVIVFALTASPSWGDSVLEFDTMVGVSGPFVGSSNPIRGINGGGLPWDIEEAKGRLGEDGHLKIEVTGLVLADHPLVPLERRLINPVSDFRAIVSCLTIDELNPEMVATVNVMTELFPANDLGDSDIETVVILPTPCLAPIIFVTSPTGSWFSVTGH